MNREFTKEGLAKRLNSLLQGQNLTRAVAADRCGISSAALQSYLYLKSEPTASHLAGMAKGFKVPSDYLLFGTARAYG